MKGYKRLMPLLTAALCCVLFAGCATPTGTAGSNPSVSQSDGSAFLEPPVLEPEQVLTVQTFPYSTTEEFTALFKQLEAEQPDQIYYHPYTGFFVEELDVEGTIRRFYTYIADETPNCASSVFVALPSGEKPEEFLVATGWTALADEYNFLLHAFTPGADAWGDEATEIAYLGAAYTLGAKTIHYSPYTGNYYFVGYGDGGRLLQQYIMTVPDNCAGLAVLEGSSIESSYLTKMQNTPAVDAAKSVAEVNVPVWLITESLSAQDRAVIDYWKSANQCTDISYQNLSVPQKTIVYQQNMLSNDAYINAYPLGKVQITEGAVSYYDQEFTRILWESFLSKTQRYRSLTGNDLRPAMDFDQVGIVRQDREIDGYPRYWLEFVPDAVQNNSDEAVPLVIALHGAGQVGDVYAPYSEWHKVAEENGFIVVFPTAYPYAENNGMARPIHNDCWSEERPSDLSFWQQLIEDVSVRYNIDASRIYATGHSNGGNSTAMIAGEMSDLVAAVAISAGRYRNVEQTVTDDMSTLHEMTSEYKVPVIQLVGTNDGGAYQSPSMYSTMMFWLERNGCVDLATSLLYRTGGYHNQIWRDKDGVPMVRFTVIEAKPHTTTPSESRLFWYEFLSHYARGEDGSVLYMQDDTILREYVMAS